jgi:hypothetical protein
MAATETLLYAREKKESKSMKTFNIELIQRDSCPLWSANAFGVYGLGETVKEALDDWVSNLTEKAIFAVEMNQKILEGSMPKITELAGTHEREI